MFGNNHIKHIMGQYEVKIIRMDVNDENYSLQNEINKVVREGYEIISHSRVRGKLWDEDILILKHRSL